VKRKPPPIGTVFRIPLRDSGYAVGVLARSRGDGTCLGYFFGPRLNLDDEIQLDALDPNNAVLVGLFGDLELLREKWLLAGTIENFDPAKWPVPLLARVDEEANRAWLSKYDENLGFLEEKEITVEEALRYPYDRMMGGGAVEIRLTKLLR